MMLSVILIAVLQGLTVAALSDVGLNLRITKAMSTLKVFTQSKFPTILVIDGNNVRGVARFGWDHVEVQSKINKYCSMNSIDYSIIVWDHGSFPFAVQIEERCLLLFAGPSLRADDVIVRQLDDLSFFFEKEYKTAVSIAVITNDVGLTDRLRKKSTGIPPIWRSPSLNTLVTTINSSRFIEILCQTDYALSPEERELQERLLVTRNLIKEFRVKLRRDLNTRHEKTWERMVLAESLRRSLENRSKHFGKEISFSHYVNYLRTKGYDTMKLSDSNTVKLEDESFIAPARLDKRQKQALERFNQWTSSQTTR